MPISYTYNTLFIHIPKCAGTTVEKMLGTCAPWEYYNFRENVPSSQIKTPQHFTYAELQNDLGNALDDFYKFAVVRNPYSRFVSEYKFRKQLFLKNGKPESASSFASFVENLKLAENQRIYVFDAHLETQVGFLKNKDGQIDTSINIFKFENMTPCWEMLTQRTGVPFKPRLWARKNEDATPYQSFYTPELATTIYNFYKDDFDTFGYSQTL